MGGVHPVCCLARAERLFCLVAVPPSPLRRDKVTPHSGSDCSVGHVHGGATAYGCDCTKPHCAGEGDLILWLITTSPPSPTSQG